MARHDVTDYGATGDGTTDDTDGVQAAIDECAAAGGGTVHLPAGEYVVEPLFLRDDITLHVGGGATLLASEAIYDYPTMDGRRTGEGDEREQTVAAPISAKGAENVAITGQGTIDGQGQVWWDAKAAGELPEHGRPRLINLYDCENVLIRDVTVRNSPNWNIHPVYCENVTVDNVTVRGPEDSPNTDGINPESCKNVRISNCDVDVGDDCVTIKSGKNEQGRRVGEPCQNVVVTNCTMYHGHGGVVIGSEMSGDVRNVTVSNCVFDGTDNGLRIKTERGRGGVVENVRATGLVMRDLKRSAFIATMFYQGRGVDEPRPVTEETPELREIHYSDITIDGTPNVTTIRGLPEMPIEDFSLENVRVRNAENGIRASSVDGFDLRDVSVDAAETPAIDVERGTGIDLSNVEDPDPHPDQPVVRLDDADAVVRDCVADENVGTFLEHADSDVLLLGNHLEAAEREVVADD